MQVHQTSPRQTSPRLAYLSQGKLHLKGDSGSTTFESAFGKSLRDRAAQIHQRHAWKAQGRGAQFMSGMLWPGTVGDPAEFPISITSVCRGRTEGELLYSLETNEVGGIFAVAPSGAEQRLFHTADYRIRHISLHDDRKTVAASVMHSNFTSNIAVMEVEGSGFFEATEGDSIDLAPRWVPGSGRRMVFQSAGVGRDAHGRMTGFSAFAVEQLDLDSGAMETLAEEPGLDLLGPQMSADGWLYYIRRPHQNGGTKVDPLTALKDAVLFPFRMCQAIFQYWNFFSMRYTGKPLSGGKNGARHPDLRQMMVWGNLIDADRAAQENRFGEADARPMVPASWELVKRKDGQVVTLAKGVLSFDLSGGQVVYSNGTGVWTIPSGGSTPERLLVHQMIEQVALV